MGGLYLSISESSASFTACPQWRHVEIDISENPVIKFSLPQCGHVRLLQSSENSISQIVALKIGFRHRLHHDIAFVADDVSESRFIVPNQRPQRPATLWIAEILMLKNGTFGYSQAQAPVEVFFPQRPKHCHGGYETRRQRREYWEEFGGRSKGAPFHDDDFGQVFLGLTWPPFPFPPVGPSVLRGVLSHPYLLGPPAITSSIALPPKSRCEEKAKVLSCE
jgi:hypothetical protein